MERYAGNYPQMFDDLQKKHLLFGEIDLPPTNNIVLYDSDDDGYDGMSVSGNEKVKRQREDF